MTARKPTAPTLAYRDAKGQWRECKTDKPVSPSPTLAEARRAMDNLKASEGYRSGELDWAGPMLWTIDAALARHDAREQAVAELIEAAEDYHAAGLDLEDARPLAEGNERYYFAAAVFMRTLNRASAALARLESTEKGD